MRQEIEREMLRKWRWKFLTDYAGPVVLVLCLVAALAWAAGAQDRPRPQQQQQQKPESVALALALLSNNLQELVERHDRDLATIRTSWQSTVAEAADREAWWHDCVKRKDCLEWVTTASTGQPVVPSKPTSESVSKPVPLKQGE